MKSLLRVLLTLGAALVAPLASAQAVGPADGYLATYQNWEARRLVAEEGAAPLCVARALHPAILDGDIFWVFNPAVADRLPGGYLAVDWRLFFRAEGGAAAVDDTPAFVLRRGSDSAGYNRPEDADALIAAMRRGVEMRVRIDGADGQGREIAVSLLGFTRASEAAGRACGML